MAKTKNISNNEDLQFFEDFDFSKLPLRMSRRRRCARRGFCTPTTDENLIYGVKLFPIRFARCAKVVCRLLLGNSENLLMMRMIPRILIRRSNLALIASRSLRRFAIVFPAA